MLRNVGWKNKISQVSWFNFPNLCNQGPKIATNQTVFAEKSFVGDVWKLTWKQWFEAILGFKVKYRVAE